MERDLREPTEPPAHGGLVGRGWEVPELLLKLSTDRPEPLVLHGLAGVGKSALAAMVARNLNAPVHWLTLGDTVDVEQVLLRLLAECGAPRDSIVRAATKGRSSFSRELRRQCVRVLSGRALVLDGVRPSAARPLLDALRKHPRLTVIVTTRQGAGWARNAHLHEVRPLKSADAFVVAAAYTREDSEFLEQLTTAARGLPCLARVAGALARDRRQGPQTEVRGPDELVALALDDCTSDEFRVLTLLALRGSDAPFTVRTVRSLIQLHSPPLDAGAALSGLLKRQLVQRWNGPEQHCLPAPVAEAVRRRPHPDLPARQVLAEAAGRTLQGTACLLDGRERPSLPGIQPLDQLALPQIAAYVDEFMNLLADKQTPLRQRGQIADALAPVLSVLGDAHRLVWLQRRWQRPSVSRALAALARDVGLPELARGLLAGDDSSSAVLERAEVDQQTGRLQAALAALSDEPATGPQGAWHLLVRGAVLSDQGDARGAERLLRIAVEQHRRFSCRRGHGWALLHLARTYLARGWALEAEELLGQAEEILGAVGDVRGRNWVATERLRVISSVDVDERAERVAMAHSKAEDIRGLAWAEFYRGLTHAVQGRFVTAQEYLVRADQLFVRCQDAVGSSWVRHRLALLRYRDLYVLRGDPDGDRQAWELVHAEFLATGCRFGIAWTSLELAARSPAPEPLVQAAESEFRALGDVRGLAWAAAVQAVRSDPPARPDLRALAGILPHELPDRDEILREIVEFCEAGGPLYGHPIPFHARDLTVTDAPPSDLMGVAGPNGPRCRVRITLLDESPTAGTTARLLLRVAPEPGHPWTAGTEGTPWLSATALPLTRASVEPASALLRPSQQDDHGAEFDFTPHRTGTHRIRFTIALERTGTVLQQVETELDILDSDQPGSHAAPHAVTHHGR
ncbi:NB-ARC domain-containing protein [Streptomyces sp. NPDC050803]|uniref:NB-ARC domain-containing protein n=1 Tax=unclassified Streptomyces TaxID=2593676 RepID=UPI00342D060D